MPMTLEQQIAEAEESYHNLLIGRSARVVVDQNGERVEFTAANRADLYNYIQRLKSQLNPAVPAFDPTAYHPTTFVF